MNPLDRHAVAEMLRRSTSMSPATRAEVNKVLGAVATTEPAPATTIEEVERMATAGIPEATTIEQAEQHLKTLQASLRVAEQTSTELRSMGLFEDARRWLALHSQLSRQYPLLHRQVTALKVEEKQLVSCDDAQALFCGFLMRIRNALELLPASQSSLVNPADPEHSRTILQRWVDNTMKTLHQHPSVTL